MKSGGESTPWKIRAARRKLSEGKAPATERRRFLWRGAGVAWRRPANKTRFGTRATNVSTWISSETSLSSMSASVSMGADKQLCRFRERLTIASVVIP